MSSERLVTICTVTTQAEADVIESVLRAAEIPIVHDHEYATTAGLGDAMGIHIAVQEEDVERALELLNTERDVEPETEEAPSE